jgi:hypothetical protein
VRIDHDRVRDARRDRMPGGDGPHQLALALVAPAQAARRAEQAPEGLGVVAGMQDEQPHAPQHGVLHTRGHGVVDVLVRGVPPPGQHVGFREDRVGQAVLGLLERRRPGPHPIAELGLQALGDGGVHPVRVDRPDVLLFTLVDVLAPHRHPQRLHAPHV